MIDSIVSGGRCVRVRETFPGDEKGRPPVAAFPRRLASPTRARTNRLQKDSFDPSDDDPLRADVSRRRRTSYESYTGPTCVPLCFLGPRRMRQDMTITLVNRTRFLSGKRLEAFGRRALDTRFG